MPTFAARFAGMRSYPLSDLPALKRRLRADGVDLIDLGAGDADLPPPPAAVAALQRAAADPAHSRYAFQAGLPAFREAIAAWMAQRFGVAVDPWTEVLPLIGSKEGLAHLPLAYLEPGDVAIVPEPGYQAYYGGTVLAGGEPYLVPLRPEHDFLVPLEALPEAVLRRAKILFLNYPNNPTTAIAPRSYLEQVVAFCREHDLLLVYDNAYSEIAFDGYVPPSILEIDGAREVAVEFHSLSKTYNMTGWRVGWAVGQREAIAALTKVKTFVDNGAPLFVQEAAAAALAAHRDWVPGNVEVFRRRRDAAVAALREAGFDVAVPQATMYLWVPLPEGEASEPFARRLLLEEGVAVLPGVALGEGGEGFVRLALTVAEDRLREAVARMARLLSRAS